MFLGHDGDGVGYAACAAGLKFNGGGEVALELGDVGEEDGFFFGEMLG